MSLQENAAQQSVSRKVFVARCTEDITAEDLRNYFNRFGEVIDVFIPKPFRSFAFVTFSDPDVARGLCGEDHIIKGTSVHVTTAAPKGGDKFGNDNRMGRGSTGGGANFGRGQMAFGHPVGNPVQVLTKPPPAGPGGDANMGNVNMNFLSSAMLAAAQAVLQGQQGWGQAQPGQPAQENQQASAFGNTAAATLHAPGGSSGFFGGFGTNTDQSQTNSGGYGGWGGPSRQGGSWS